jgi:hypothetical protein
MSCCSSANHSAMILRLALYVEQMPDDWDETELG